MGALAEPCYQMPLGRLLPDVEGVSAYQDLMVSDLKLDSRQINPGDLFIATQGYRDDGTRYIADAVKRGAVAVVADAEVLDALPNCDVPLFGVADLKERVSEIAGRFFGDPSRQLQVIGVTGTNGKTSCCQFIAKALSYLGINCGVVGTIGYGVVDALKKTDNTTPDAIAMQRILAELVSRKFNAVALEVSSHGMDQGRVNGIHFDTAVFTNLSRDHLDYHGDMESYADSKQRFFHLPGIKRAIINMDDQYGGRIAEQLPDRLALHGVSIHHRDADISAANSECSAQGIKASLRTPWGEGILSSVLLGRFNLVNLLLVVGVLCAQGVSLPRALEALAQLEGVPGRMQHFGGGGLPTVVVDYAHTPGALGAVLNTLRELCSGELWCVFGCGGERDQGKRPMMGEVAERAADTLVLTNDNPRGENPQKIIADIESGLRKPGKVIVETGRAQAIQLAVNSAKAGDLVLVAGKGHEEWQEIKGARVAFSDVEQVKQALNIKRLAELDKSSE